MSTPAPLQADDPARPDQITADQNKIDRAVDPVQHPEPSAS